jgi:hypothetical protein
MRKKEVILFFFALIPFCFVILNIFWWIQISSDYSKSLEQVKNEYHEKFPAFIGAGGHRVALLNILLLSVASFLFYKVQNDQKLKSLSRIFFTISVILIAWQFFTLM